MQMAAWTAAAAGHTKNVAIYLQRRMHSQKKANQKASKSQWNKNVAYFSAATTCHATLREKTGGVRECNQHAQTTIH